MTLPNLLIVGAAKSGTTSLHNYLNQHPDIFMCTPKEPHFLINNEIGSQRIPNGILNQYEYESLFKVSSEIKYKGESSVMYLAYPEIAIKNIKKYLGDKVKIIIMLRNPVERAYSGYQHVKRFNMMENLSFEDALDSSEKRYQETLNMTPASRYLSLGNYYNQVKSYQQQFEDVHVVIYDDYKANFIEELNKVFDFLSINRININTAQRHMVGGWEWNNEIIKKLMTQNNLIKTLIKYFIPFKRFHKLIRNKLQKNNTKLVGLIKPETEKRLKEYYKEDVGQLSSLLKRDLNHWVI